MALSELIMPKMGESIMEATILKWHKKVGDFVKMDETVLDIATDKVDSEVPSTAEGIITELLFNENDVVPVGVALCKIETEVHAAAAVATEVAEPVAAAAPVFEAAPTFEPAPVHQFVQEPVAAAPEFIPFVPQTQEPVYSSSIGSNNKFYSPLVLNIANSEGLSLSELEKINGTGAEGRVSKKDVLQYIADKRAGKLPVFNPTQNFQTPQFAAPITADVSTSNQNVGFYPVAAPTVALASELQSTASAAAEMPKTVAPQPAAKVEEEFDPSKYKNAEIVQMDRMRKLIAKHMVDSKATSPHVTSFTEADVTNMVSWRNKVKDEFEKTEGTKVTFTPMILECIIKVMKKYPLINSSIVGDKIIIKKDFNIGMATALPSGNLIVPVIKNANDMSFVNLTKSVNTLANNARAGKLSPDDVMDGTFTFTNVGTFGSLMGTPIINQPQVAILATGEIKKRPMVIETNMGDFIGIRHMMYLSLSYDHRIIDGSIGASFLRDVAKELEAWDENKQYKSGGSEWYVE